MLQGYKRIIEPPPRKPPPTNKTVEILPYHNKTSVVLHLERKLHEGEKNGGNRVV